MKTATAIRHGITPDLVTANLGTLITLHAQTARGRRWLTRHVPDASRGSVTAEHRYGIDIMRGALAAGLKLQDATTERTATR